VHRNAWRTYTPSIASRDELWRMGVSDVEVWGRGVDLTLFSPDRRSDALRAELGVGSAFTFLHVGRLAPEKSVHVVVRAFSRLLEMPGTEGVRLIVAGSGPEEASLRAIAPRGTVFLGNLDRASELPVLYSSADAFAFASTTETLGLVVLEAMASGVPVIAAPAGGVAEHLRDNVNGLAFPAGDVEALARAMHRMATESGVRERLGDGALASARALGWDAELDRLDQSYRAVCAEAGTVRDLPLRLGLKKS
jgi:glycosyltransferase involved in cell wall biosynthesis